MMITAHSGCDGTPDNSLAFIRYALTLSPDAVEVDVHRRADGVLVLRHDADETGRYENCPTLSAVLALLREQLHVGINCDCKDAGLEESIISLHTAEAPHTPLLLSGTLSPQTLRDNPALLQEATMLLNAEEIVPDFYEAMQSRRNGGALCAEQAARVCRSCGATVVNVRYDVCLPSFSETLTAHGIGVSVWTVNDLDTARTFAARDVFNITTRSAEVLLKALK